MQININDTTVDRQFQKASKYPPVRFSTTFFESIECIAFAANRADEMICDITENDNSEIFLTLMDSSL